MGGWCRWALVSPDGVAPSRMVSVSASVNLLLHRKVQKFSSGTGSTRWSRKRGHKTVVVWCGGCGIWLVKIPLYSSFFRDFIRDLWHTAGQPRYTWQWLLSGHVCVCVCVCMCACLCVCVCVCVRELLAVSVRLSTSKQFISCILLTFSCFQ